MNIVQNFGGIACWGKLINWCSPSSARLFTTKPKMRVCSYHFVEIEPTYDHPHPSKNMSYDNSAKLKLINPDGSRRKLALKSPPPVPNKKIE